MRCLTTLLCVIAAGAVMPAEAGAPLWPPQYKIRPQETQRLTAADVVGPDGIVYPNWTMTGVQGGIPQIAAAAKIEEFGGKPDDGKDDSAALHKACEKVGVGGGGAVVLGEGVYHLDRPATVRHDGVVIRGQGADRTKLIFRYGLAEGGAQFYWPAAGSRVGRDTRIELHCYPHGLTQMTMLADDKVVGTWKRSTHSGGTFAFTLRGRHVLGKLPDGPHTLKGIGHYGQKTGPAAEMPIVLDSTYGDTRQVASAAAAITFLGQGWTGPKLRLASDGKRGDQFVELKDVDGVKAGDALFIRAPATERWKKLTRNRCTWGLYRCSMVEATAVEGKVVRLRQPLRIDFPVIDEAFAQKVVPIRRCGVEALTLQQTKPLWTSGVVFQFGWECWARGVTVKKCGRFPIYGSYAKQCEIRDCVFDDAWFKGGGGTAYTGWDKCWDCLIDNVTTHKLRHAPCFQWAASGNVIRRSTFHDSDGQWHAGWTHENLIEQCVITSRRGHGSYGYGMWASPPGDRAHGPNGPRNVVYNSHVTSQRAGVWLGGMNENWLFLHNRFVVSSGPGLYATTFSFDHILRGNVFVVKDGKSPMVQLATADCTGVEIIGNTLVGGSGKPVAGPARPAVLKDNRVLPATADPPGRPTPAVASIYEWQQARKQAIHDAAGRRVRRRPRP